MEKSILRAILKALVQDLKEFKEWPKLQSHTSEIIRGEED